MSRPPDPGLYWSESDVRDLMSSVCGRLATRLRECDERARWLALGALVGFPGAADELRAIAASKVREADEVMSDE